MKTALLFIYIGRTWFWKPLGSVITNHYTIYILTLYKSQKSTWSRYIVLYLICALSWYILTTCISAVSFLFYSQNWFGLAASFALASASSGFLELFRIWINKQLFNSTLNSHLQHSYIILGTFHWIVFKRLS